MRVLAPLLVGRAVEHIPDTTEFLRQRTEILALQAGEAGPVSQSIAGLDCALWDLAARRAGLPLYRLLGGTRSRVPAYASGINPEDCLETVQAARNLGFNAFKLKIGFETERDVSNLKALRKALGPKPQLMADVNQGWSLEAAVNAVQRLESLGLQWLEEPLRVDAPLTAWSELHRRSPVPLAGGENMLGERDFLQAVTSGSFGVLQPDVAKWGGVSGCLRVARAALDAGVRYCPHYLGAGLGLAVSAHLLAAVGGDGLLEVDVNPNPLRSLVFPEGDQLVDGAVSLAERPGHGAELDWVALKPYHAATVDA